MGTAKGKIFLPPTQKKMSVLPKKEENKKLGCSLTAFAWTFLFFIFGQVITDASNTLQLGRGKENVSITKTHFLFELRRSPGP